MIILCFVLLLYHFNQYYRKNIKFYAKPTFRKEFDKKKLRSPCCGRVVYADFVTPDTSHFMVKQGRRLLNPVPYFVKDPTEEYLHIGIFMSPFNNHHLVTMNDDQEILRTVHQTGKYDQMWDSSDNASLTSWWKDWFNKKVDRFIELNAREVFVTNNSDVMFCMIFDKVVNKMTDMYSKTGKRSVIGFVHVGSQTDIFIKKSALKSLNIKVGQKVDFDTLLAELN